MLDFFNLHKYQIRAYKHTLKHRFAALFMEMGLGKTIVTLSLINELVEGFEIGTTLVIGTKRIIESVWAPEAKKWNHTKDLKIVKIVGNPAERRAAMKTKADVHLISRDNIVWLCDEYGGYELPWDMLVIDELSSFKNTNSQRFRALKRVRKSFYRIVGLTGTPTPNGLIDIWAQMFLIDGGERLGKHITKFRRKHFYREGEHARYFPRDETTTARVMKSISDITISMRTKDYLELPPLIVNDIRVDLPAPIMAKYEEFKKELVLDMFGEGQEITAKNSNVLMGKLLQFTGGAIYDEDKNVHEIHKEKLEAVESIINESGGPVLIAWAFRHERDRLLKHLKAYSPVQMSKPEHVDQWNRGEIPVLLMHPASGGHGLNLQEGGDRVVWYSQFFNLEFYQQLNTRLYRQGRKKPVFLDRIICPGTMDMKALRALEGKTNVQDEVLELVKAYC